MTKVFIIVIDYCLGVGLLTRFTATTAARTIYNRHYSSKSQLIRNCKSIIESKMMNNGNATTLHKPIDMGKCSAAYECGQRNIVDGMRIGVGSGTTARYLIDYIGERVRDGYLNDICCIPTSFMVIVYFHFIMTYSII